MKTQSMWRAIYKSAGTTIKTRWHRDNLDAQRALMKRIGQFHFLGMCDGDCFEAGMCWSAPRNGGEVRQERRTEKTALNVPETEPQRK